MTNNIEKLYELANIHKKLDCQRCGAKELKSGKCFEVDCESTYPSFTNTKQLELIKWIAINGEVCRIDATEKDKWFIENDFKTSECFADFSQALAGLVCELWDDLTSEQREEIKRILE